MCKTNCAKCGVIKNDDNCFRNRTGRKAGQFLSKCKQCGYAYAKEYRKNRYANDPKYREECLRKRREYQKGNISQKQASLAQAKKYRTTIEGRISALMSKAKSRAKDKGLEFDLTREFVAGLFYLQQNKCKLTEIEFNYDPPTNTVYNPLAPSLDRIDPQGGYTQDNTRLILTCVNIAMHQYGQEFFDMWVKAYVGKLGQEENVEILS